jgi:acyl dehydratase
MPIDSSAVGSKSDPVDREWTSKDVLLYAVGIGAGIDELAFTTENTKDVELQVFPTFATVVGGGASRSPQNRSAMSRVGSFNPAMLVHGEQAIELPAPLPVEGKVSLQATITGIWDKGSGAVIESESEATDAQTGELRFRTRSASFIRGEGSFGGERGPSGPRNIPPEKEPDHVVRYQTLPQQALLYRLSGDRNPLHSDPNFAKAGGFDAPILHGLCTYGHTGRALLHALCGSDPARFKSIEGRFSKPVWPGDELEIRMWKTADGEAVFQTRRQTGDVVIDQGRLLYED